MFLPFNKNVPFSISFLSTKHSHSTPFFFRFPKTHQCDECAVHVLMHPTCLITQRGKHPIHVVLAHELRVDDDQIAEEERGCEVVRVDARFQVSLSEFLLSLKLIFSCEFVVYGFLF
jgi:hypothetical protein